MNLRYGDFLTAETSTESLWRRRGREQCLVTSSEHFDREKKIEQWKEGNWYFLELCKDVKRGKRQEAQLLGETERQIIILLYWYHDQALFWGLWNPLRPQRPFFFFLNSQKKGHAVQTRGPPSASLLLPHSIYFLLICTSFKMSTVLHSLRIFLPACNAVYDLLKIFKNMSWNHLKIS